MSGIVTLNSRILKRFLVGALPYALMQVASPEIAFPVS